MNSLRNQNQVRNMSGFGMVPGVDMYYYEANNIDILRKLLHDAESEELRITQRGFGRSYGDPAWCAEQICLTAGAESIEWTSEKTAWVGGRVSLRQLCEACLEKGLWPKVVTGTSAPTIAGLVASCAHGKNAFKVGTFGDCVLAIRFVLASGEMVEIQPENEFFWSICGSMGLLGIVWEVHIEFAEAKSGYLDVEPVLLKSLTSAFAFFGDAMNHDYAVAWIDFTPPNGVRGLAHRANYSHEIGTPSPRFSGPKNLATKLVPFLKPALSSNGIKLMNQLKMATSSRSAGKIHRRSLPDFNFLLDQIPGWQTAYLPQGLVQVQVFLPLEHAENGFLEIHSLMQETQIFTTLGVMKRHFLSSSLLNPGVDGFSMAMDFVAHRSEPIWERLMQEIHEVTVKLDGRFYLAKDALLSKETWISSMPSDNLAKFRVSKTALDPNGLFTSNQAQRLGICD